MYLGFLLCVTSFRHCHYPLCSFLLIIIHLTLSQSDFCQPQCWAAVVKVRTAVEPTLKLAKLSLDLRLLALFSRKLNLLNCTYSPTCVFNTLFLPSYHILWHCNPWTPLFISPKPCPSSYNQPLYSNKSKYSCGCHRTGAQTTTLLDSVAKLYMCIDVQIKILHADMLPNCNADVRGHLCKA